MRKLLYIGFLACVLSYISCKDGNDNTNMDRDFMVQAAYANKAEIDMGQLASSKSNRDSVKTFANMMVSDHQQAYNELKDLGLKNIGVKVPNDPDPEHKQIREQLAGFSGRAFDSAYMQVQVQDHINAISLFEEEINTGKDQRVITYAKKYLPALRSHLVRARNIAGSIY